MRHIKHIQAFGFFVVVLALLGLSCSGASDIGNLFATPTFTPTNTFTPSPTFTPSATPTSTMTPSPTPLPTGVLSEEQADGSTLFVDYDNQFQMVLPRQWIVIPLSSNDVASIIQDMADKNPELQDVAATFLEMDADVIRVVALNSDSKYFTKGYSTNLTVTAIEDPLMSTMPLEFVTGAVEESLKQQGAKLVSTHADVITNPQGVEIGSFDFIQTAPTATGGKVQVRSKVMLFQTGGKVIMVQLVTPQQFGDELIPMLDVVADSIELLQP